MWSTGGGGGRVKGWGKLGPPVLHVGGGDRPANQFGRKKVWKDFSGKVSRSSGSGNGRLIRKRGVLRGVAWGRRGMKAGKRGGKGKT